MKFLEYDIKTGRILSEVTSSEDPEPEDGRGYYEIGQNEDIDLNNKLPANKYTDDILINLNNAISLAVTFYDRTDKQEILKSIKLIEEYIEEVQIDLDLLELDINPQTFRKIKRKSKTKI